MNLFGQGPLILDESPDDGGGTPASTPDGQDNDATDDNASKNKSDDQNGKSDDKSATSDDKTDDKTSTSDEGKDDAKTGDTDVDDDTLTKASAKVAIVCCSSFCRISLMSF